MTTSQVVEMSVIVNNNSPIQDYVHPDDHTQPTYETTPGFKPFTVFYMLQMVPNAYLVDSFFCYVCSAVVGFIYTHIKFHAQMVKQLGFCPKSSTVPNNPDGK